MEYAQIRDPDLMACPARTHRVHAVTPPALVLQLPAGAASRTVLVRRGAGVVLLTRLIVTRGSRVSAAAEIPGIAGVAVSTPGRPQDVCRSAGATTTCTRGQEWCPMPVARWRITFTKRAGPAARVRLLFRVGTPPRRS
jgi:hypothetical protein